MSASVALQDAVLARLKADATVSGLVGDRVFDQAPDSSPYPYIALGASYVVPGRGDDLTYRVEVLQLDIWVDKSGRKWPAKEIVDAVISALDGASFDLADPYALSRCEVVLARVVDERDGLLVQGIVQIECGVETRT